MSSRDMSMDTIMEDDESFISNTNATIYGASYISGRTESLISGPNIPNSSSTSEDDCHQQQISTAAGGGGGGDTNDDLIVSSSASSNWFTNNNNNQGAVRIFNVDFRALLSISPTQHQNDFAQAKISSFRRCRSDNYSKVQLLFPTRDRRQSMLNRSIAFSKKMYHTMVSEQIQIMNHTNHQRSSSSFRSRWTTFLHDRFVHAVELLGGHERANPQSILELMDIKDLKLIHVKNHLQIYRAFKNDGAMEI